ncbi:MAG: 50S ribosomal protein L18 [Gemmatimonadetes bacterium]|nr:50S ribosomal protein L18 [Gemmatimonadota bacterium]
MTRINPSKLRKSRRLQRWRRHVRIRRKVRGTADRPRLVVFRSLRNLEGQVVDDDSHRTLVGLSTLAPELREGAAAADDGGRKVAVARALGSLLAARAREQGIEAVVFDRGGYRYHGRVRAFAEGARAGGLVF